MDDPDLTEKTPRDFDREEPTNAADDVPITVTAPKRSAEIPPLPPLRAARGTRTGIQAVTPNKRRATLPPPIPVAARSSTGIQVPPRAASNPGIPLPRASTKTGMAVPEPLFTTTSGPAKLIPFLPPSDDAPAAAPPSVVVAPEPPPLPALPVPPLPLPPLPKPSPSWFAEEPHVTAAPPIAEREDEVEETEYFDRASERTSGPPKQRNVAAITGIAVGSLFVITLLTLGLRGHGSRTEPAKPAPAAAAAPKFEPPPAPPPAPAPAKIAVVKPAPLPEPAPVATPEPVEVAAAAPAPAPEAEKVAAPAPAKVAAAAPPVEEPPAASARIAELPVTSLPTGATVTLIVNGDATIVGKTPLTAKIDPTRDYDIVLALRDLPTKVIHVDPKTTHVLAVDLVPEATPAAAPAAAPAPAPEKRRSSTSRSAAKPKAVAVAEPAPKPAPAPRAAPKPAAAVPAGSGILMVSAKPPCNIAIDGKLTGLVTPQRSIPLPPGVHAVTLTNSGQKIAKTLSVNIVAKQPTKLIQDFTKR